MHEGTIAIVKLDKGFGFIAELGGPDLFFHMNDVVELEWNEQLVGQRVKFDVVATPKGMRARYVQAAE